MPHRYQDFKSKLTPTPSDIEGPFYLSGAPFRDELTEDHQLYIWGHVFNTDGEPLVGAILDFWQADAEGHYDEHGMKFRGKQATDDDAAWSLHTLVPGDYKISEPGKPDDFRCAHIHVKVSADGYKTLTTQLYFNGDKFNSTDHWFNPKMVVERPIGKIDFVLEKE